MIWLDVYRFQQWTDIHRSTPCLVQYRACGNLNWTKSRESLWRWMRIDYTYSGFGNARTEYHKINDLVQDYSNSIANTLGLRRSCTTRWYHLCRRGNKIIPIYSSPIYSELYNLSGFFYWHTFTLIPAWISNYIHHKVWNGITNPFLNINGKPLKFRNG